MPADPAADPCSCRRERMRSVGLHPRRFRQSRRISPVTGRGRAVLAVRGRALTEPTIGVARFGSHVPIIPADAPMPALVLQSRPLFELAKRAFDIAFSLALIVASAPVWLTAALLIAVTSSGPVLYGQ